MLKIAIAGLAAVALLGACAPQSRVEQLEARVAELEDLINQVADLLGRSPEAVTVTGAAVKVPRRDCRKGTVAVWEKDGTLGCLSPSVAHTVDGYVLPFPATKGCTGQYIIMGAEGLTCDTPEHPYN